MRFFIKWHTLQISHYLEMFVAIFALSFCSLPVVISMELVTGSNSGV